jgi:uncharacterized membrane protein YfcA
MSSYAVLFVAGLGIGTFGTLIGAGGGWMIVPLLLFGYHFSPQEAVGTSLAVVFLNALSGSVAYMVQGRVLYKMGLAFAAATMPGALVGALLVQYLDSRWFSMLFGVFLLLIAVFLQLGRNLPFTPLAHEHASNETLQTFRSPYMRLGIVLSFLVGVVSSLFGVGGGIIHVPFLIVLLGIPVHTATATSHFVLAITSLTGTVAFLRHGQIWVAVAVSMGLGVLLGAQVGALLSTRMHSEPIRRTLAAALAVFACWLILRTAL